MRVASGNKHLFNEVLLLCAHTDDTLTASVLRHVCIRLLTLNITRMAHCEYAGMSFNEVLKVNLLSCLNNFSASFITKLVLYLAKLVFENILNLTLVGKNGLKLRYNNGKLCNSVFNLLPFKSGKLTESHLNDSLRLSVGKTESFYKSLFCIGNRLASLNYSYHFIYIVDSYLISLKNMNFTKCLIKVEFCSVYYNALLELYVSVKNSTERENFRLSSVYYKHIDRAGVLELSVLIKLI